MRRGVPAHWGDHPSAAAAFRWLHRTVLQRGRIFRCQLCSARSADLLLCDCCDEAMCRPCLGVAEGSLFGIGFECSACAVLSLPYLVSAATHSPALQTLHAAQLVTLSQQLKPSSWSACHRWVGKIQGFMRETGLVIFPILSGSDAAAFSLFLQSLKQEGYSWGSLRQVRFAVSVFHRNIPGISAADADPFSRFPQLSNIWSGLARSVNQVVRRRRPLPGEWVVNQVLSLYRRFGQLRQSHPRQARVALRDAVILSFGFFGIRRGAELFANRERNMGLLVSHVSLRRYHSIELFIQSQKNDTVGKGNSISLAWRTSSGVPLGDLVTTYLELLRADGVPSSAPLFGPTTPSGLFRPVAAGAISKFNHIVRDYLKESFPRASAEQLSWYSFHSLRRGGATWARSRGVPLGLVLAQGLWTTVEGMKSYIVPSDSEKALTVSLM